MEQDGGLCSGYQFTVSSLWLSEIRNESVGGIIVRLWGVMSCTGEKIEFQVLLVLYFNDTSDQRLPADFHLNRWPGGGLLRVLLLGGRVLLM